MPPEPTTLPASRSTSETTDIHARFAAFRDRQIRVLEQLAAGVSLTQTFESVVRMIQEQSPGTIASVLVLDPDGLHLRHGAAPDLPEAYNRLIDGVAIGPCVGSCGTAAFHGRRVIVSDIATDPLWQPYKELALGHGLRACWSEPIFDSQGRVLGSFAMYHRHACHPSEEDLQIIRVAAHLAGIAIERQRTEEAFRLAERERDRLERDVVEQRRTEELRQASEQLALATLNAISANICVLDESGVITAVNRAWLDFAEQNHFLQRGAGVGSNYLAVCDAARGQCDYAGAFADGLRSVLRGDVPEFSMEYPCHSPAEQCWFIGRVTRFQPSDVFAMARFQAMELSYDPGDDAARSRALAGILAAFPAGDPRRNIFADLFGELPARPVFTRDGFNDGSTSAFLPDFRPRPALSPMVLPPIATLDGAQAFFDRMEARSSRIGLGDEHRGSNNWLVGGAHTPRAVTRSSRTTRTSRSSARRSGGTCT